MEVTIKITYDPYVNVYDWRVATNKDFIREGYCAPDDLKGIISNLVGWILVENRA